MMSWPPYFYADDKGEVVGADIEIIRAIFKEAKCQLQIDPEMPSQRRTAMFVEGRLDMLVAGTDTEQRRGYAWFSKAYRAETISLFALPQQGAGLRDVAGLDTLLARRLTLLSPNAGWFGEDYEKNAPALARAGLLSHFGAYEQGLVMLKAGRGKLLLADRSSLLSEAARLNMTLVELPHPVSRTKVHMMFSKQTVPYADVQALDAAAQRLEARGVLRGIRRRYGID
jgi:polar amino acid transport system substrate-binding protein